MDKESKKQILLIEKDENLLNSLYFILSGEGYSVTAVKDERRTFNHIECIKPDLILFDCIHSEIDGFTMSEFLQKETDHNGHIFILAAPENNEDSIAKALDSYADTIITKPVLPKILISQLRSLFRRTDRTSKNSPIIFSEKLVIDPTSREVFIDNIPIELTRSEFDILLLLAREPKRVFSRMQIISRVKGEDYFVTERSIDFQIFRLRQKLGKYGDILETVRGSGYRLSAEALD